MALKSVSDAVGIEKKNSKINAPFELRGPSNSAEDEHIRYVHGEATSAYTIWRGMPHIKTNQANRNSFPQAASSRNSSSTLWKNT